MVHNPVSGCRVSHRLLSQWLYKFPALVPGIASSPADGVPCEIFGGKTALMGNVFRLLNEKRLFHSVFLFPLEPTVGKTMARPCSRSGLRPYFRCLPSCRRRAASNARVRSAGILTRSQLISKALPAVFPSFSFSIFAVKPSSQRLLFHCAAACGTAPAFSAFRPAVVSVRRN